MKMNDFYYLIKFIIRLSICLL